MIVTVTHASLAAHDRLYAQALAESQRATRRRMVATMLIYAVGAGLNLGFVFSQEDYHRWWVFAANGSAGLWTTLLLGWEVYQFIFPHPPSVSLHPHFERIQRDIDTAQRLRVNGAWMAQYNRAMERHL